MTTGGDEYDVDPEVFETITITVPDAKGGRNRAIKGLTRWTIRLSTAAADELEKGLMRHSPAVRLKLRIYRGERELQPELGEEPELPTVVTHDAGEDAAGFGEVRSAERVLAQVNRAIELGNQRLAAVVAETEAATKRRDEVLERDRKLIESSHASTLAQVVKDREFLAAEHQRAFNLDTQRWTEIASSAQSLSTVRGLLQESVLADRWEGYLKIAKDAALGVADSKLGQVLALKLTTTMAAEMSKRLQSGGAKGPDGRPLEVSAEDILLATVLGSSQFAGRRKELAAIAAMAPDPVGPALLMAPAFCLGEIGVEALGELLVRTRPPPPPSPEETAIARAA